MQYEMELMYTFGTIALKFIFIIYEPRHEKTQHFAYAKTKTQISFGVTAKLISAFVFATWIEHSLFFLNAKFQASSHLVWLYSPVCVGPEDRFSQNKAQLILMWKPGTGSHFLLTANLF